MRKITIAIAAFAASFLIAGAAQAKQISVKLTQEQVKTTCGSLIVNAGSHFGCKKSCGDGKTCGFSCEKGGKNCKGVVVQMTAPPGSSTNRPPTAGILDSGVLSTSAQGPAQTGRPAAPSAPPPVQLR